MQETFLPKKLWFWFGELLECNCEIDGNTFTCHKELEEDLECNEITVRTESET
jgi:hypothetical protein